MDSLKSGCTGGTARGHRRVNLANGIAVPGGTCDSGPGPGPSSVAGLPLTSSHEGLPCWEFDVDELAATRT